MQRIYAHSPASIHSTLFSPIKLGNLAKGLGVKPSTFYAWLYGQRTMPAAKRRQLADIIERKNIPSPIEVIRKLRAEADLMDKKPKRGRGVARGWRNEKQPAPHATDPVKSARL